MWKNVMTACAISIATLATASAAAEPNEDPYAPGREIVRDLERIVTERGVQDTFTATLGGAKQVVTVRGTDRENPILIYVHGGPGAAESPFAWAFERPWEDFFTVVQWDQRGAGRSYLVNDPKAIASTMTLDRIRDDAIELIDLLHQRYGKRDVFLLGHSFGSVIGMKVAAKRPDLLRAYIGMGQYIDTEAGEKAGYAWTLEQAKHDGNTAAVRELEALQPYPGDTTIEKIDAERKWANHYGALFWRHSDGDFYFHLARISPEYTPQQRTHYDEGSEYSTKLLEKQLKGLSFSSITTLGCPVYMLLGRHDGLTPASVAAAWLDRVEAPKKGRFWFENSAHMAMIEEPGRTLDALLKIRDATSVNAPSDHHAD
jgi:pimeloyl-ACP methyl ester carboxylesterase